MILLDIPQGAITFASAFPGALAAKVVAAFGFMLSMHGRLKSVETVMTHSDTQRVEATNARMDILWDLYRAGTLNSGTLDSPRNPMKQGRWDELAKKLHKEVIDEEEAREFLAALLEKREQAIRETDAATLSIVGAGITFTRWWLGETEWQLQQEEKELRDQK